MCFAKLRISVAAEICIISVKKRKEKLSTAIILYPLFLGEPFPTPSKPFSARAGMFLLRVRVGCYGGRQPL